VTAPYYSHAGVTIYHGDCREILPEIPPGSVDLVLTDPPYGDETHAGALGAGGTAALVDFASTTADALRGIMEVAPCSRWWVSFMEWRHLAALERQPPAGWDFIRFGVWVKPNGAPQFTGDRPATGWEAVGIFHRPAPKHWNGGGRHAVWVEPKICGEHPTAKPLRLVRELARLFSDDDGPILDPFMGSGTTLVAAKQLGRRAIGIEIEERYCEIAVRRLAQEVLPLEDWRDSARMGEAHPTLRGLGE
jgi:site-specific DNA-methyltransferase (adenine-specific)